MTNTDIKVYSVKEVAKILRTSCQLVRRMIHSGELPAVKVGREWRIPSTGLIDFLEEG